MNGTSVLSTRSRRLLPTAIGLGLVSLAVLVSVVLDSRPSSPLAVLMITVGFALVEARRMTFRIGKDRMTHGFIELPAIFGLALVSPQLLLLARFVGAGSAVSWRLRRASERIPFNIGLYCAQTIGVAAWLQWSPLHSWRLDVLFAFAMTDVVSSLAIFAVICISGGAIQRRDAARSLATSVVITTISALLGLVLLAAWQTWDLAVFASLPFAGLFFKSWRGEIERSRKADALAALSHLTAELTASTPGDASISEFASQLAALARVRSVVVCVGSVAYKWADDQLITVDLPHRLGHGPTLDVHALGSLRVQLLGPSEHPVVRGASFQAGSDRVGWLILAEPEVGTSFNAETDSLVETVADRLGAWFSNSALIDDLRREVDEREYLAFHDPLTDLANRRRFRDVFDDVLQSGSHGGLVLLALDHFSLINDSVGHQQGDEALAILASRLREVSPVGSLVARLGGDEFAVLVPSLEDRALSVRQGAERAGASVRIDQFHMSEIAGQLLAAVAEPPLVLAGMSFSLTASAGITTFPADGTEPSELLREADQALQSAKAQRNGFVFYSAERHGKDHAQVTLLGELRRALEEDEIILHYQPKIDLPRGGKLTGVEALVRWNHPTRGLVFPDEFIPIAEHYDLLNDMFFYVVERSLLQLRKWSSEGFPDLTVAVNLSARNLRAPHLTRRISRMVESYGIEPGRLTLELTETALMADTDHAMRTLRALRDECGVEIAVDDFGVGLSSIAYLRDLPASEVKIDKTFCHGLPGDQANEAIVRAIHQLSTRLGKKVTVEGVETEETFSFFRDIGIDQVQGYWIARPMEPSALKDWWTKNQLRLETPAVRSMSRSAS